MPSNQTKAFILCLIAVLLTLSTTSAVSLSYPVRWDSSVYKTQLILENELRTLLAQCTTGRPTHSRLLGGGNVLEPQFYVEVTSTDDYTTSCHPSILAVFPNATIREAGGECFATTGFKSGIAGCTAIYGSKCTTATACANGTVCPSASDVCSIIPTLTYFDITLASGVGDVETSADNVDKAYKNLDAATKQIAAVFKDNFITVSATVKCAYRDVQLISASASGAIATDKIQIVVGSDVAITPDCIALINTVQTTDGSEALIASIASGTAPVARVEKACYTTDANGFVSKFTLGGACSLSRPLSYSCSGGDQVCPDPNATCDFINPVDTSLFKDKSLCVLHNAQAYLDANFVHILTYESALLVGDSTPFAVHAIGGLGNSACTGQFVAGSGTLSAVAGTITKFQYFFIAKTATLDAACVDVLKTVDHATYPQISTVDYSVLATPPIPTFSCFATTFTQSPLSYTLDRVIPGGRCAWKVPLGGPCLSNLDCDSTSRTTCIANPKNTGRICSRPGLIPDATDLPLTRIDVEATAFLGSAYGKSRLNTFVEKLKVLCPFESFIYNIASQNYSKAHLWVTPFDYSTCTQQMVQSAALQANTVSVETTTPESVLKPDIVEVKFNLQQLENDLDADPDMILAQEGEGETPTEPEPEPEPVDPSSIIPRLKYASIKTFKKSLPLTCHSGEAITCVSTDPQCDVPCGFGGQCLTAAQCGQFGVCNGGVCIQRGSAFLPQASNVQALSIFVAFVLGFFAIMA